MRRFRPLLLVAALVLLGVGFYNGLAGAQPASAFEAVRCQQAFARLVDPSKMSPVTARREARRLCDYVAVNHRYFYRSLK